VLPVAIGLDTWFAYRPRRDGHVRVASTRDAAKSSFWIDGVAPEPWGRFGTWPKYVEGMAWSLRESALSVHGFDGVVDSLVPTDAGLGAEAALELAAGLALLGDAHTLVDRPPWLPWPSERSAITLGRTTASWISTRLHRVVRDGRFCSIAAPWRAAT
jgi:galactokinase